MPETITPANDLDANIDPAVAAVFASFATPERRHLMRLRALILETAETTDGVGPLTETLKWGQLAYLTSDTGSGTTIRIGSARAGTVAVYTHCQTSVVRDFAEHFPEIGEVEGRRAVHVRTDRPLPIDPLRFLIRHALTYHLARR